MRKNHFQKIEQIVAKKVYTNIATIHFNIKGNRVYDANTGDLIDTDFIIDRVVYIGRMKRVSEFLVNGNILSGDMTAKLPVTLLKKNMKYMDGDPEIIIDGVKKTLADFRTFDENGGIQTEPVSYTHLTLPTKRIV